MQKHGAEAPHLRSSAGTAVRCLQVHTTSSQTSPHPAPASRQKLYGLSPMGGQRGEGGDAPPLLPSPHSLCSPAPGSGVPTTRQRLETERGGVRLDIGEECSTLRVLRPWHWVPGEAVAAPSLAGFTARLDRAGSSLVRWKGSLPWQVLG